MTVQNENYKEYYNGNDSTTVFPVTFYFLTDAQLSVILTDAAKVATTQVLNTDYTVQDAGDPSGGSVTMVVAPATGETLTILRDVPLTQLLDYIENDNFPADSHEQALDKLTMIVQEQAEVQTNTVTIAPGFGTIDAEIEPLADSLLAWDAAGTALTNILFTDAAEEFEIDKLYFGGGIVLQTVSGGIILNAGVGVNEFSIDGTLGGNSDTALPTEKAVKTYVDALITAQDLDFIADSGGAQAIDLDSEVLNLLGGTGIDTVGSALTTTFAIDSTVATLADVQTLTNKTLTDPIINKILAKAGETGIEIDADGAVSLFYDNAVKLDTKAAGVDVTGDLSADSLSLANNQPLNLGDALAAKVLSDGSYFLVMNGAGTEVMIRAIQDGAVDLYFNNTGVLHTTIDGFQLNLGAAVNEFSIDGLLSGNSDTALPTEKAVKTYVDTTVGPLGGILSFAGDAGGTIQVNLATELQTLEGGNNITTTGSSLTMSFALDASPIINEILAKAGETGVKIIADGEVELYFNGLLAMETTAAGIDVYDTSGDDPAIYLRDDAGAIGAGLVVTDGTTLDIGVGSSLEKGLRIVENGETRLYYDGILAVSTWVSGLEVHDTVGNDPYIKFFDDAAVAQGMMGTLNGDWFVQSGPSLDNAIFARDGGGVELYHTGSKVLATRAGGITVSDGANDSILYQNGVATRLQNSALGGTLSIRGTNAVGAVKSILYGDPDGDTWLYNSGNAVFYVFSNGVGINIQQQIYFGDPDTDGSWYIDISSGVMRFRRRAAGAYSTQGSFGS